MFKGVSKLREKRDCSSVKMQILRYVCLLLQIVRHIISLQIDALQNFKCQTKLDLF